ncbi:unnamed protein product [Symbiodinium necroappetens]|uniref:Uncharacterized protein n=1 Tax=Symbiodinium necroappetens TaxID=1628268 RepID=A0A812WDD7_9DINO|nr:unnamed protein product [Symbiodinium necroappetens]
MAPASSKPASKKKASVDDCAAESQRKLNASLNASLARGKALKNLQKNAAYDLTTPILPGTCDVTLGELMQTEKLSLPDAVQVMLKFRKDAAITDPDEVGLSLPPAKPGASKPKHEPKHDELSPPKGILKKGKSRLDAEPPQDDDDDVHGHTAVKKASSKRKPDAKGSEPKVSKGKAKPKRGSSFEDPCLSEPAPSSPASNPKKKAKKPEPEPTPASNPKKKAKKPEPDHQDEEPEEGAPSTELENSKQQKKKKPQNKPPAPEEKEPEGEGSSPASSKNSSQKKKKPQNKPPVPEEKEPEGEARASKKEEAVEASTNNRGKKRTKSKTFNRSHAKEDLAEGTAKEAASKGHDGDEGSADYQADLQEMIDEIDRADAEPPCPRRKRYKQSEPNQGAPKDTKDSKWPKDWPHDAQPNLLAEGWSCSSLALGEEQMDATNPATDPAELETQVNGSQTVTELIESLGASASQVGANGDYSHLLGLLNNLKLQIENPKPSPGSATTGAEKEGGGKADKEGEGKADKEGEGKAEQEYEGEAEQEYEGEAEQEYEGEEWNDDSWNEGEEEEYGQHEDQEEQAESEELMSNQESAKRVLQEGKDAKDSGGLASRPVATPARSLDAIIQKLKPVPAGEPKEPNPEPAQLARDVPSGTPSAAAAPASDEQKINSTTHKKEYMRLKRIVESGQLSAYPSMHQLANGIVKERAELLKRWVSSGENLANCEHLIIAQRTCNQEGRRKMKLIAVKDMRKVEHIISTRQGIEATWHVNDRDAPGIHEETKYWVTIEETAEDSVNVQHKQQFSAQAAATAAAAQNILSAPIEPTMMSRPRANPSPGPLSGDVLRAFDGYHQNLAEAAGVAAPAGV